MRHNKYKDIFCIFLLNRCRIFYLWAASFFLHENFMKCLRKLNLIIKLENKGFYIDIRHHMLFIQFVEMYIEIETFLNSGFRRIYTLYWSENPKTCLHKMYLRGRFSVCPLFHVFVCMRMFALSHRQVHTIMYRVEKKWYMFLPMASRSPSIMWNYSSKGERS